MTIYLVHHVSKRLLFRHEPGGRWSRMDDGAWVDVVVDAESFLTADPFVREVGDHVLGREGERYLIAITEADDQLAPGCIVHLGTGKVSPPLKIGSILVQGEPDEWTPIKLANAIDG